VALDNFFKNLLKDMFGAAIEAGISVGTLDKYIDTILHGDNPMIQRSNLHSLLKTPKTHIMEFKSHRDHYSKRDLSKLIGYGAFYAENTNLGPLEYQSKLSLWFVATQLNPELAEILTSDRIHSTIDPGIYRLEGDPDYQIVIINELEIREENIFFLLNSSGKKLNEFIQAIIHRRLRFTKEMHKYLRSKLYIDYREVENLTEVKEYFDLDVKENIRAAIHDIGLQKVMDAIGKEQAIEAIGKEEILEYLTHKLSREELLELFDKLTKK
jgi:hypothetical protein